MENTSNSITIYFKKPVLKKFIYNAGQYIILKVYINGRKYSRAYSLSSSPFKSNDLSITIKRIPGGIVSNYILNNVRIGDIYEVSEPIGSFVIDNVNFSNNIFFWTAGSGITPIYSILNELLISSPSVQVYLTYGNATKKDSIFLSELLDLSLKYKERFNLNLFFSRDQEMLIENSFSGRINADYVKSYTLSCLNSIDTSKHFVCGPSEMKKMIIETLENIGVSEESIFSEDFELTVNEQDLMEVIDSEVDLLVNGNEYKIFVKKGKTILDGYLDEGIDLPYSCQTGSCETCKARILSGETKMIGIKAKMELSKDEILLCCSFPLTNRVQIEI